MYLPGPVSTQDYLDVSFLFIVYLPVLMIILIQTSHLIDYNPGQI
jgi:hypothetical protein